MSDRQVRHAMCVCVRRIMPPSDKLSPCLAFRELILGRGWASNLCRWVARPREPLSARLGSPSEYSDQGEQGVGRGKGSKLAVFGGDKIRGRECSTCQSTCVVGGSFGKGRGGCQTPPLPLVFLGLVTKTACNHLIRGTG